MSCFELGCDAIPISDAIVSSFLCMVTGRAGSVCMLMSVAVVQDPGFKAWFEHSHEWLRPYAAFCVLRDLFGTAEHWRWGGFSHGTPQASLLQQG